MVGEPCEIRGAAGRRAQRRECLRVQARRSIQADGLLDRQAGELVSKRHAGGGRHEHARRQTLVETILDGVAGESLEQPELGLLGNDRDRLEHRSGGRAQVCGAREHGVPDRVGDPLGPHGERLDHEERVAGGLAVELVRVDAVRLGELGDGRGRQ